MSLTLTDLFCGATTASSPPPLTSLHAVSLFTGSKGES